jgi:hypothetical protein
VVPPEIIVFGRLRQEDQEFKSSLSYIMRSSQQKETKSKRNVTEEVLYDLHN